MIGFEGGIPVSIDGERLGSVELVERLHDLGGAHGVGRIDHVEDRLVGIKSREIYEAPAAVILHAAHHALEGLVLSKEQLRFNRLVADELAQIIYDGLWFSALSRDLRTYAMSSQRVVSGDVRVRLDHGQAIVVGPAVAAVACTTRTSRRTTRATRSTTPRRSGSSRSSGCRSASRPRATAPWARTTAPPGPGRSRCWRTCRRRSRKARAPGRADPARRRSVIRARARCRMPYGEAVTSPSRDPRPDVPPSRLTHSRRATDRLRQLAFLHEFAQLATQARDWDELMRTLVDRTTVAMGVEVCSFYLLDRTGERLTLAATNGLDTAQVGRVSLAIGAGHHRAGGGRAAPVDVARRHRRSAVLAGSAASTSPASTRCCPCRSSGTTPSSACSTPRRPRRASSTRSEVEFLLTIAALLAGIVEKGRLQAEAEAQLDRLSQLDAARAELLAVVTHELRTPLGGRARLRRPARRRRRERRRGPDRRRSSRTGAPAATEQVTRLDRLVDSILASVRGEGLTGLRRDPFDVVGAIGNTVGTLALLLRTRRGALGAADGALVARRRRRAVPPGARAPARQRGQVRAAGAGRVHRRVARGRRDPGLHHRRRAGRPDRRLGGRVPAVRPGRPARSRGSGIGLFAARRLMEAMGGRVWIERNGYGGSRFVVAPAGGLTPLGRVSPGWRRAGPRRGGARSRA